MVVKRWLIPGSLEFLLLGTAFAAALLLARGSRARAWGRRLVIALAAVYILMSLPLVADGLVTASIGGLKPAQASDLRGVGVMVVLDAGARHYEVAGRVVNLPVSASVFRGFEALRVYELLPPGARAIVSSGGYGDAAQQQLEGTALRDELVRGGIPADRLVTDTTSRNTFEHARFVRSWLDEHHLSGFVLVTSATHARRAQLTFRAAGLDPIMSPAPMRSDGRHGRVWPDTASLEISREAIYDLLGLAYYEMRGWV